MRGHSAPLTHPPTLRRVAVRDSSFRAPSPRSLCALLPYLAPPSRERDGHPDRQTTTCHPTAARERIRSPGFLSTYSRYTCSSRTIAAQIPLLPHPNLASIDRDS